MSTLLLTGVKILGPLAGAVRALIAVVESVKVDRKEFELRRVEDLSYTIAEVISTGKEIGKTYDDLSIATDRSDETLKSLLKRLVEQKQLLSVAINQLEEVKRHFDFAAPEELKELKLTLQVKKGIIEIVGLTTESVLLKGEGPGSYNGAMPFRKFVEWYSGYLPDSYDTDEANENFAELEKLNQVLYQHARKLHQNS